MKDDEILVTFNLPTIIELILGNEDTGLSNSIIPQHVAQILSHKIPPGSLTWKITQELNKENQLVWVLWRYQAWSEHNSRRDRAKAWQDKIILEGWLESANITNIANSIMSETGMKEQDARRIAQQLLRKGNIMIVLKEMFGIEKLVTTREEL